MIWYWLIGWLLCGIGATISLLYVDKKDKDLIEISLEEIAWGIVFTSLGPIMFILLIVFLIQEYKDKTIFTIEKRKNK